MMSHCRHCCCALAASLAACAIAPADVIHVPADHPTISAAILAAGAGDEIVVAPGVYREQLYFEGLSIVLRSSGGPGVTFISGDLDDDGIADAGPLLTFELGETPSMVVEGFTLIDGTDAGNGVAGAISIFDSSPTLRDLVIRGTFSDGASAVSADLAAPVFERVRFVGNDAPGGAGALSVGIFANVLLRDCLFAGNFADGGTGAVSIGGLGEATLINCVFSANSADGGTAAVSVEGTGVLSAFNCTFNNNLQADGSPLAVSVSSNATALFANCIFRAPGTGAILAGPPPALTVRNSNVRGGFAAGVGIIDADPLFADPDGPDGQPGTEDDNLRLLSGSPSIDAGADADVPDGVLTDADGQARIVGPVDHGAYEFQSQAPCAADYDGNGEHEVADIFAFLADWFAGVPAATDFGGTPGVPAIFAFLAAWFAGCP